MDGPDSEASFQVVEGHPTSRVVIHVPHASTLIPDWDRQRIRLNGDDLTRELAFMTDARTDEIAEAAADLAAVRPWIFVNRRSRLVVDPERFPNPEQEPMAAPDIGMGAVYTRTSHGELLRDEQDLRVSSVMVELRRDTYLGHDNGIATVARMLTRLIDTANV